MDNATPEWIAGSLELPGTSFTLREVRPEDAPLLLQALTFDEMANFLRSTPVLGCDPSVWGLGQPLSAAPARFAVVPAGTDLAVGIVEMRAEPNLMLKH
jgi:hypothetical protein